MNETDPNFLEAVLAVAVLLGPLSVWAVFLKCKSDRLHREIDAEREQERQAS